jgi:hypothetical protein
VKGETDGPATDRYSEQYRSHGRRRNQGQRRYIAAAGTDSGRKRELDIIKKDYKTVPGVWGLRIAVY